MCVYRELAPSFPSPPDITGVILAGGRSTRMGGEDKGLKILHRQPLFSHVLAHLAPQVQGIMINANRNMERYQQGGFQVFQDTLPGFPGPLAGMLAGLMAAPNEWSVFVPCDVPVFPQDLVQRLWHGRGDSLASFVGNGGRDHPTFALLHRALVPELENYLGRGERKVMLFLNLIHARRVVFDDPYPAFANLNTPKDLQNWA
ncbi:molybdenum cofactor guanylyltransferase MobA [Biostraticola tofi]|uniref:Molybdenum cofactor guanylyltransferase n=1 Tax=Biostraticola tofi TaxID=466109 RepID=A0A4R3YLA8_9GAMM|nr:molybdenum cofactor guanylyltransferase MobA [Biostraticola tofi]TCV93565.1 molybdenum cofactor guanylyltransferase [Biostraticola tofi]